LVAGIRNNVVLRASGVVVGVMDGAIAGVNAADDAGVAREFAQQTEETCVEIARVRDLIVVAGTRVDYFGVTFAARVPFSTDNTLVAGVVERVHMLFGAWVVTFVVIAGFTWVPAEISVFRRAWVKCTIAILFRPGIGHNPVFLRSWIPRACGVLV
jgi:hypothetical protein